MNKRIIILGTALVILSLLIVGFTNWNDDETDESIASNNKTLPEIRKG